MSFWTELKSKLHQQDQPPPDSWERCYEMKNAVAQLLRPSSILEFGVRTGYAAFAFLSACPQAKYVGIDNNSDTHGGFSGAINHARSILEGFDATIIERSSDDYIRSLQEDQTDQAPRRYAGLPRFDLIHVDGDHSLQGCLADMESAAGLHPRTILVDDYFGIPEVHEACDRFAREHVKQFVQLTFTDNHNGAALFIPLDMAVPYCPVKAQ
jgi:predicted O-methyltransferase YrrM